MNATQSSPEKWTEESVLAWHQWSPGLVSFTVSRPAGFAFLPGQFARLTLAQGGAESVSRAFSIASSPQESALEFFAVIVPEGEFSRRLARLQPGDRLRIDKDSYGFFTTDNFHDGRDLWMLATGTGLAPFISMLRDGAVFRRFERTIVAHSVRFAQQLAYRKEIADLANKVSRDRLRYVPIVTREDLPGVLRHRITQHLMDGQLEAAARLTLDENRSRLMICGNPQMCAEMRHLLTEHGMRVNRSRQPGQLLFENYW